uniref:Uncharacterized protein n=1 Tax=Meloidogyne enterolobii TaxID=390850 RepID=A0A6V7WQU2_MELEN|nr:unnamed protein product [Meloidogyne enterolobii]
MLYSFLFLIFLFLFVKSQRCPFFGEYECPIGYECQFDRCLDEMGKEPYGDCLKIKCGRDSVCVDAGKCISFSGRLCGRNVLVGKGLARTIVSDCGPRGKCMGGRCSIDKCADILCDETNEICRDGMCMSITSILCFSPFDCGPPSFYECKQQKCQRRFDTLGPVLTHPSPKCDPGEILSGDKCVTNDGEACTRIVCPSGNSCFNGLCIPSSGTNCANSGECPDLHLCRDGRCVSDVCAANGRVKCPPEHACSPTSNPEGECRHFQGLLCSHTSAVEDCPPPYYCIGGICTKDECYRKACQIGERCDSGICLRIEGTPCRDAAKECGEQFTCDNGICRDQIDVQSTTIFPFNNNNPSIKSSQSGGIWS